MKKLADCIETIGASRADVDNWLARLDLRTDYAPTRPGKYRLFTRDNILELSALAALVQGGFPPQKAVPYAHSVVRGSRGGSREWLVFNPSDTSTAAGADELRPDVLVRYASRSPTPMVVAIQVGEITRRVDALFGHSSDEGRSE